MKYPLFFIISFFIVFQSCKKDVYHDPYAASLAAFNKFKKENNNSYNYTTIWSSWTGYSGKMIITVQDGKVIARNYKVTMPDKDNPSNTKVYEEWEENISNLNSHNSVSPSLTLDEVYTKAKNEWLNANKNANQIYFEAENNGMISSCGYVPKGCMDDCFNGITIINIAIGPFVVIPN